MYVTLNNRLDVIALLESKNTCFFSGYNCDHRLIEPQYEISNNVVGATSNGADRPAHTRSLIRAFASSLNIL